MEIHSESRIHYPPQRVYEAYRDRLPEIAAYIPDIREIQVVSREAGTAGPKLHNTWIADRDIPSFASAFLKPEHLRWDDFAEWNDAGRFVAWRLKTRAFTDGVNCAGRNTFIADGDGTRVVLTGDLQIGLTEIPGVPSFLAKRLAPQVEKFIVSLITPNLERVNASIEKFLDEVG